MGWRFQRRVGIAPGIRINLGKRGISASVGPRGAHYTIGTAGQRTSLSLPGTGLGWYSQTRWSRGGRGQTGSLTERVIGSIIGLAIAWAVLSWIASFGGH
jgi:hypothetical protein